jgi:hypothetical protein
LIKTTVEIYSKGIQHNLVCTFRSYILFSMIFRMFGHFLGILRQIHGNGKGLKAGGTTSSPEAIVPGCGGPLTRRPKAKAAWPACAGRRSAPPCRNHRARARRWRDRRVLYGGSGAARSVARALWRGGTPIGQQGGGGGGAHQQGQSTVRWKGTVAQRSADDGVGPTVADDNPRVFLQLRTSEGV